MNTVFFNACIYNPPGVDEWAKAIEIKNMLFCSEMVGARQGIDPQTGQHFDDAKRCIDTLDGSDDQPHAVFEGTARTVFPRLDAILKSQDR